MSLTITQQYLMCAVNQRGRISRFNTVKLGYFVGAALIEMELDHTITMDQLDVKVIGPVDEDKNYLHPLYEFLKERKQTTLNKIVEEYCCSFSDKRVKELMEGVSESLNKLGLTEEIKGVFSSKPIYAPKKSIVYQIIEEVRAQFLGDDEIKDDIAALTILLDKGHCLNGYFNRTERKQIRDTLDEVMEREDDDMAKIMSAYVYKMAGVIGNAITLAGM